VIFAAAFVCALTLSTASFGQNQSNLPAFPGAEGFGSQSIGGRGGQVIEVTNLNDAGPGSLRAALEASGPRIVVFRVGGTIELDSDIEVQNPYLTVAGQTAPGDGITLKNSPLNAKTPLKIETHDVILRYIRSRPGSNPAESGTLDALTIANEDADVYNVIVDHGSFSWATDEVTNLYYDAHELTVQWSIIAEGLDCSTHTEGKQAQCHSMGMLIGHDGGHNYSIHHNLFAHNRRRNPRIKTSGVVDVVNNVVYNPGTGGNSRSPTYVHGEWGVVPANYVGNYFKPGIDSGAAEWFIDTKLITAVYTEDNTVPHLVMSPDPEDQANLVSVRHSAAPVTTTSAAEAYDQVLADAGANLGLNCDGTTYVRRDSADSRVVDDVRYGTGSIIDEPEEVGGWPVLSSGVACADGDHDGMPDEWEALIGLDAADPSDRNDLAPSGYTWLETYLNPPFLPEASLSVQAVNPAAGPPSGGTDVGVTGSGFEDGATASFGAEPASNVVVSSSTFIMAQTPAGVEGLVDVTITNPDQESRTLIDGFQYINVTNADLALTKTDDADPIESGDTFTYSLLVTNNGPQEAKDVVVEDSLPAGPTLLSTSGCAEDPIGVPTCTLGTIAAGASSGYTISVSTAPDAVATVRNQATVSSISVNDPDSANNVASEDTTINAPSAPPEAPSELTARAQTVGKGKNRTYAGFVSLSWSDNSSTEDEFVIERCDEIALVGRGKKKKATCSGTWGTVFSASVGANTTDFDDTTALAESTYLYRVRAVNAIGSSDYSNEASETTPIE
jgi:uncharacterized repeat protein (TIGR01451 family)